MHIHCPGQTGHGSLLHENTAGEKVRYIIDKFMDLRAQEKKKLEENSNFTIGDVTTINITQLKVAYNKINNKILQISSLITNYVVSFEVILKRQTIRSDYFK